MGSAVIAETDKLAARRNILATVARWRVRRLVGTRLGDHEHYTDTRRAEQTARRGRPGIARLFATALGMFAGDLR